MVVQMVCLANSRKHNGRCIAGWTREYGWVRPVGSGSTGELVPGEYSCAAGEISLFDLVQIELQFAASLPKQPENWTCRPETWELVKRPAPVSMLRRIDQHTVLVGPLFGGTTDRLIADGKNEPSSLVMVKPADASWQISRGFRGNRQWRVNFRLGADQFELAVTDPIIEQKFAHLSLGVYRSEDLKLDESRLRFTVSLGEEFNGNHYKLVAAVIELPTSGAYHI